MIRTILTLAIVLSLWVNIAQAWKDTKGDQMRVSQKLIESNQQGPPEKTNYLGVPCCDNSGCMAQDSICVHGACSCKKDHFPHNGHCLDCPPGKIGDVCSCTCFCKMGYECNHGHCECPPGDVGDKCDSYCPCNYDELACLNGTCEGVLGAPCDDDFTCIVEHSECYRNVCDCRGGCYPEDGQCLPCPDGEEYDFCNSYCPCNDGLDCVDEECSCLRNKDFGDMCYRNCQCMHFYECLDGLCKCPTQRGSLDDPCDDNCTCHDGLYCKNGRCACLKESWTHYGSACYGDCPCSSFYECISGSCDCPGDDGGDQCNENCTCAAGLQCFNGICACMDKDTRTYQEDCYEEGNCPCAAGLECRSNLCECSQTDGLGDPCVTPNCSCAAGLTCNGLNECECMDRSTRTFREACYEEGNCPCDAGFECNSNVCGCAATSGFGDPCNTMCPCQGGLFCNSTNQCDCLSDEATPGYGDTCYGGCPCDGFYTCRGGTCSCPDNGEGDPCDGNCVCDTGLTCNAGGVCECISPPAYNAACYTTCTCADIYECVFHAGSNKCRCGSKDGSYGTICDATCDCQAGYSCVDGTCQCDSNSGSGAVCDSYCPCDRELECDDTCRCPYFVGYGDACGDTCDCDTGFDCNSDGICECDSFTGFGAFCSSDCGCDSPYQCDNHCKCPPGPRGFGDWCDDNCGCDGGLTCGVNNTCVCANDVRRRDASCTSDNCGCEFPFYCRSPPDYDCKCETGVGAMCNAADCPCATHMQCVDDSCSCFDLEVGSTCDGNDPDIHECLCNGLPDERCVNNVCTDCTVKAAGATYQTFPMPKTWADALDFCVSKGGDLAKITSQADQNAVQSSFNAPGCAATKNGGVWIGLRQVGIDGYTWSQSGLLRLDGDGAGIGGAYEKFDTGHAYDNIGRDPDDCIWFNQYNDYQWLDDSCDEEKAFVCQF